ncbi:MAG TPA: ABC transporter permease [Opitutaceae bacterium]|jgi:phospholipid/cholesterol/gamma-HCH transport system permease protein|nr:ABC transporter permease [Opitutaceae bacterium]
MKQLTAIFEGIGSSVLLTVRAFTMLPAAPRIIRRVVEQTFIAGYTSLPIVSILSFFIGSVLALQAGITMQNIGTKELIGSLVGESLVRELGPVMIAILVAGRVGSAITAELASMKVYNEVDALVTMNIPPERFLVLPRLIAVLLYMPVLTMIGIVIGWIGGAVVCKFVGFINLAPEQFFESLRQYLTTKEMFDGLLKAEIFGFCVVLIACTIGLRTSGGPREIGNSVTRSVVTSLVTILVLDYFITKALA